MFEMLEKLFGGACDAIMLRRLGLRSANAKPKHYMLTPVNPGAVKRAKVKAARKAAKKGKQK